MKLFGFELTRAKQNPVESVVAPSFLDGSAITTTAVGGYNGYVLDIEGHIKNENELIRKYRDTASYSDCDSAIDEVVNEIIVSTEEENQVVIELEKLELSDSIKEKITEEFEEVLNLLKFSDNGYDIVRTWYVDGRLYYHILIDSTKPAEGIQELRFVDPRKIKKIKQIKKERGDKGVEIVKSAEEYYVYNENGVSESNAQGVKLSKDSVVLVPSGLIDANNGMALSYLHKAIKPVNQLKMMEDATVIYTITRAPERRVFYIDVGDLPKVKAEQYVADIMAKYRNKITYDAESGEVKETKNHLSMLEDFWMPRREGGRGTEITTLKGGDTLSSIENVNYFQQKVYSAMNVPIGRLQPSDGFNIGRSSEISREELKFSKFVARLRKKFSILFQEILKVQLVSKGILTIENWEEIKDDIKYDFLKDNYFTELKELEIIQQRYQALQLLDPYVGKYVSMESVKKDILRKSEEEIKNETKQMEKEKKENPEYFPFLFPEEDPMNQPMNPAPEADSN